MSHNRGENWNGSGMSMADVHEILMGESLVLWDLGKGTESLRRWAMAAMVRRAKAVLEKEGYELTAAVGVEDVVPSPGARAVNAGEVSIYTVRRGSNGQRISTVEEAASRDLTPDESAEALLARLLQRPEFREKLMKMASKRGLAVTGESKDGRTRSGKARMAKLTPEQRREFASMAAKKRWQDKGEKK